MGHGRAVSLMVLVTLLWSSAGVVSRHLHVAQGFEVTFWRSAFTALSLVLLLSAVRGRALWQGLLQAHRLVWLSGLCWAVMFTAFMQALTMTRVANVLVTMALGPLVTALFARLFLYHRLPVRTWMAITVAGAGIAWMFGHEMQTTDSRSVAGMLVGLAVPVAAALNFTVLQHAGHRRTRLAGVAAVAAVAAESESAAAEPHDMLPAVLIGAVLSSLVALPMAWPLRSNAHDLWWLAGLGVFQLAVPCLLVVRLTRVLPAPEISLLGLLEVIFGVLWAWWGAGESLSATTLVGGCLVLGALLGNEWLALSRRRSPGC